MRVRQAVCVIAEVQILPCFLLGLVARSTDIRARYD